MKIIARAGMVLMLALIICFTAACGADISTKLTVDDSFNGTREITAVIDSDDITKVTGGAAALEQVIKESKPADMDYTVKNNGGNTVITFTIKFSGLEEYRTKINNIIDAGRTEDSDLVPEVVFETGETYFKEGFRLSENFTSVDLLNWYINALEESGIISESQGNWYEIGENKIVFSGKEYSSGSRLEADEQIKRCLSGINVTTTVTTSGSFERVIEFTSDNDTEEELEKAGCVLEEYLKNLCPDGDTFEKTSEEDSYNNTYAFTLNADSAEELVEKTDAVLQTKNKLSITAEALEDTPGTAAISVTESIDGTYYIDYDSARVTSRLKVYDGVEYGDADTSYSTEDGYLIYRPNAGGEYTFSGEWKIGFSEIVFSAGASGLDKMNASFVFKPIEGLDSSLAESAGTLIKSAAEKGGKLTEKDNVYTVSFSGSKDDVEKEINSFIGAASGYVPEKDGNGKYAYFNVELEKYNTLSRLKKGIRGSISYDFSPVTGSSDITFENKSGLFGGTRYSANGSYEDGKEIAGSSGSLYFYTESVSVLWTAVLAAALIVLIAGIVMLIMNRNEFSKLKTVLAGMKKPKAPAVQQEAADAPSESVDEFPEPVTPEKEPAMAAAGAAGEAPATEPEQQTVSESGSGEEDLL